MIRLHDYFRSSASYRVRIALNLKGLKYEATSWDLRSRAHQQPAYSEINPQQLLPALEIDGLVLPQSLAIMEYLEERYPEPALLPDNPAGRARVRALSLAVACDIHPLNNLRVLQYLEKPLGHMESERQLWYRQWVEAGFSGLERELSRSLDTGAFCHGDRPTFADICLVPQVFNARRFGVDLTPYPTILSVADTAEGLAAFAAAHPDRSAPSQ